MMAINNAYKQNLEHLKERLKDELFLETLKDELSFFGIEDRLAPEKQEDAYLLELLLLHEGEILIRTIYKCGIKKLRRGDYVSKTQKVVFLETANFAATCDSSYIFEFFMPYMSLVLDFFTETLGHKFDVLFKGSHQGNWLAPHFVIRLKEYADECKSPKCPESPLQVTIFVNEEYPSSIPFSKSTFSKSTLDVLAQKRKAYEEWLAKNEVPKNGRAILKYIGDKVYGWSCLRTKDEFEKLCVELEAILLSYALKKAEYCRSDRWLFRYNELDLCYWGQYYQDNVDPFRNGEFDLSFTTEYYLMYYANWQCDQFITHPNVWFPTLPQQYCVKLGELALGDAIKLASNNDCEYFEEVDGQRSEIVDATPYRYRGMKRPYPINFVHYLERGSDDEDLLKQAIHVWNGQRFAILPVQYANPKLFNDCVLAMGRFEDDSEKHPHDETIKLMQKIARTANRMREIKFPYPSVHPPTEAGNTVGNPLNVKDNDAIEAIRELTAAAKEPRPVFQVPIPKDAPFEPVGKAEQFQNPPPALSELIETDVFIKKITPLPKYDNPNSKWITSETAAANLGVSEKRLSNLRAKNDCVNYKEEEYAGFVIGRDDNGLIWCKSSATSKTIFYLFSDVEKRMKKKNKIS